MQIVTHKLPRLPTGQPHSPPATTNPNRILFRMILPGPVRGPKWSLACLLRCSHADWMLMALKFLETALTQLSDDILHSSVYHVLHWS
jgi:hypothetical protein